MKDFLRPGFGQVLAQARAEKSLSSADVAAKLKLTVRQIEALEAEDVEQLPGDVFVRGFVRNYARFLELDPNELIVPMDAESAVAQTITAHSEGVSLARSGLKRWVVIPLVILAVFVATVAVLYQWLSQGEDVLVAQSPVETTTLVPVTPATPAAVPVPPVQDAPPGVTEMSADTAAADPVAPSPAGAVAAAVAPAPLAKPAPPVDQGQAAAAPIAEAEKPAKPVSSASKHTLQFAASHDAWIQVVDGEGKRYSKLVRAGGSDSLTGVAPFRLVVGEAAQVQLSYDGRAIDLTPFIGQKVARLTLE